LITFFGKKTTFWENLITFLEKLSLFSEILVTFLGKLPHFGKFWSLFWENDYFLGNFCHISRGMPSIFLKEEKSIKKMIFS
jgi:hypothetical protein